MDLALKILKAHIKGDGFRLIRPGRPIEVIGDKALFDWELESSLLPIVLHPGMNLGQSYMDGKWRVKGASLLDLLKILCQAFPTNHSLWKQPFRSFIANVRSLNNVVRSHRNVSHHYDLDEILFRLFLDEDMHYSCAYYREPDMTLEAAQQAKCEHIAKKLRLQPGQTILDIGCGWGSMSMYLAEHFDVQVTGVTLSKEQLRAAKQRAFARGLTDKVHFQLQDYRLHQNTYDRVVSIGMFEHVGRKQYSTFFKKIKAFLTDDGIALLHTIGVNHPPAPTSPWITKHIFPGGYIPAISELSAAVEFSGLVHTDIEVWRVHYADTLAEWHRRFQLHRDKFADRLGERFCRMWEFYLLGSEASFRWRGLMVIHSQLAKNQTAVPLTRNYLYT